MLLTIEKLIYGGDGLARLPADEHGPGKAVFVPFVLEGEKTEATLIEQKRNFARGRADKIIQPSPSRIAPHCPYFGDCGGCHYQHATYSHQLEIKSAILKENFRRIAKRDLGLEPVLHPSPEWNYRNRTRLKLRTTPDFALGYFKPNSHDLLPIEQCSISSDLINEAIATLWQLGREKQIPEEIHEVELFANAEDSEFLLEAYCSPAPPNSDRFATALKVARPALAGIAFFRSVTSSHPSDAKPIRTSGASELTYKTRAAIYRVSAGSFFQVNRYLIDELIDIVTREVTGGAALDLYAGVGLFSSALARSFAQVIAVESSPTSFADLLYNSPSNVKAVRSTTEQFLQRASATLRPDLVVVDPPRNGLGETVVRSLAGLGASRIVYVSCEPATASRDLAGLLSSGYHIEQAHVVDLFPQTFHIESVWHLAR